MATTHKMLAFGQFGTSVGSGVTGNILTPSSSNIALIKTVLIHNTNTTPEVVEIYHNGHGDSDRVLRVTVAKDETFEWALSHMVVVDGTATPAETWKAKADTGSKVNYFIFGAEES